MSMRRIQGGNPFDRAVEAAAAKLFCHTQFTGDDVTARRLAREMLEAASDAMFRAAASLPRMADEWQP